MKLKAKSPVNIAPLYTDSTREINENKMPEYTWYSVHAKHRLTEQLQIHVNVSYPISKAKKWITGIEKNVHENVH